jgi:hypothetical protein
MNLLNYILFSEVYFKYIKMTLTFYIAVRVYHTCEIYMVFFMILTTQRGPKKMYTHIDRCYYKHFQSWTKM